jgi:L-ribulose-5-phosphate 3-epimerase
MLSTGTAAMNMRQASRRQFLKSSFTAACAAGFACRDLSHSAGETLTSIPGIPPSRLKKGVVLSMLPANLSYKDRFQMAADVGFEVVQTPTEEDERKAEEIKQAAEKATIRIDSVMNMDHWKYPLSSSDPAVVEKGLAGMRTSLHNAKLWGADAVLLVPAVVN